MEKISINARIKTLRKANRFSQAGFGEAIGLKQGAVSNLEKEGNTVTEQNISLICQRFHVRREWLVDGDGEMYNHPEDSLFAAFAKQYKLNDSEQSVVRYFLELPESERQSMLRHITAMADAITAGSNPQRDEAHRMLDKELDAQEKGPSASTTGSSATTVTKIDA